MADWTPPAKDKDAGWKPPAKDSSSTPQQPPFVQAPMQGPPPVASSTGADTSLLTSAPNGVPATPPVQYSLPEETFDPTFAKPAGQAFTKQEVAQAAPGKLQEAQDRAFFNERFAPLDQKGVTQYREQVLPQERATLKQVEQGMLADLGQLERSAAQVQALYDAGDPGFTQAAQDHNQAVASLQRQREAYEDMARKLDRDERMLDMQEYGIKAQTGTKTGAYWNNALNSVGQSVSGFNSPILDLMLAIDPATPKEGETQDAANNRVKERLREGMRSTPREMGGTTGTTNEYIDELGRGSFFHEAALGATGSVPTFFMGPGGLGLMTQAMDNTDALMEGPEFDDIDPAKKRLFSATVGAVTGQLERAGLRNAALNRTIVGRVLREAAQEIPAGAPAQEVSRILRREVDTRAINRVMNTVVGGAGDEALTEGAQSVSENAMKDAFNALEGKQVFDTPEGVDGYVSDMFQSMAQGAVGGTMFAAAGGVSRAMRGEGLGAKTTPKEFEMIEQLIKDPNFRESYARQQEEDVESGKMTAAQAEQINADLDLAETLIDRTPDDLPPETRKEAFDLMLQREALKKKDPTLVSTKVEAINEKLRALQGVPKTPEPTTNADGTTTEPEPIAPTGEEAAQTSVLPEPSQTAEGQVAPEVILTETPTPQEDAVRQQETGALPPQPEAGSGQEVRPAQQVEPEAVEVPPQPQVVDEEQSERENRPTRSGVGGERVGAVEGASAGDEDRSLNKAPTPTSPKTGVPDKPPAPPAKEQPVESEPRKVKKKIATQRAYEGSFRKEVKQEIKKLGLLRDVENQKKANKRAKELINQIGIEAALDAVRNNDIPGAASVYIVNEAMQRNERKLLTERDPEKVMAIYADQAKLLNQFDEMGVQGGRVTSAIGDVYRTSDLGFSSTKKSSEWEQKFGAPPPEQLVEKWRERDKEFAQLKEKLAEAEKRAKAAESAATIKAIQDSIGRQKGQKRTYAQRSKDVADKFRKLKLKEIQLKDADGNDINVTRLSAGLDWNALVEVGAVAIEKTGEIADGIAAIVDKLSKEKWFADLDARNKMAVMSQIEKAYREMVEEPIESGAIRVPVQAIRDAVAAGATNIDELVEVIKEQIKEEFPKATRREVRDAITNYGRIVNMSMDDLSIEVRRLKRIGRTISALEDVRNKIRPLRSGLQRDKLDAEERALNKQLREEMKGLPVDAETHERALKTALDAAKTRTRNRIEDLEREIATKERIERKGIPVQADAELKELQAERDRLKEEWSEIFEKEGRTEDERLKMAIDAAQRRMDEYQRRIRERDLDPKRATPVRETPALKAIRDAAKAAKEEYRKLQEEAGVIEKRRTEAAKSAARTRMTELERRIREKDFSKRTPKPVVTDTELTRLNAEKLRLKEEYDKEFYKNKLQNRTKWEKAKDAAIEAWGLGRALQATGELSFVLLQGGKMSLAYSITKPSVVFRAFKNSLQALASEKKSEEWLRRVKSQDWYPVAKKAKLAITEPHAELTAREELFVSDWTRLIWNAIVSPARLKSKEAYEAAKRANPFRALERASVGYLDTLRVERFLDGVEMLEMKKEQGYEVTEQEYKDVADVINTLTGRSGLGKAEVIAKPLAQIFFSPRMWASSIKLGTPYALYYFSKLSPTARKIALLDYSKYVGLTTAMVALAALRLNDDDDEETGVSVDPRSSDFMKIRIGDTRIDPWGGLQPQVVASTRLILGTASLFTDKPVDAYTTQGGKTYPLGVPFKSPTAWDVVMRMATNKLSPAASLIADAMTTKLKKDGTRVDAFGREYDLGDRVLEKTYPIFVGTVNDLLKDDPSALDGFLLFYAFLGGGVQTYEEQKKDKKKP